MERPWLPPPAGDEKSRGRPWLLLDVDGVLNPTFSGGQRQKLLRTGDWLNTAGYAEGLRWPLFLYKGHGGMLLKAALETGAELAWATTWNEEANQWVGPKVGLPKLPVLYAQRGAKPSTVLEQTKGRPFVWLDDEEYVVHYSELRQEGHGVKVNPRKGLTQNDVDKAVVLLNGFRESE
jgi:hypothetical protein